MNAFNNAQARKAFNRALTLDPDFDAATLGVGWTYYAQARWHWATGKFPYDRRTEFLATAAQIAQRVMARNDALAEPLALSGQIHMSGGDFEKAIRDASAISWVWPAKALPPRDMPATARSDA